MKKSIITVMAVLLVLTVGAAAVFSTGCNKDNKNQKNLDSLMNVFTSTVSEYTKTDIIEAKSVYGKLNGNGNGIQYFGIVLIEKSSAWDIDSLISKLDTQFEVVEYYEQKDSEISSKYLEHRKLEFDTKLEAEAEYISICFFNSMHPDSDFLDPAGH